MQNEFVFVPSAYGKDLEAELAKALQARTEIISRKTNPKLWRMTDQLNEYAAKGPDEAGRKRRRMIEKTLSLMLAVIGAVLLVAGMMEPKNRMMVTLGLICLILAAARLMPGSGAGMSRRFQKSAQTLLASLGALNLSSKPKIRFTQDGMRIETNRNTAEYAYEKMETLVETPRLFLLTHSGAATVLQKKDLILGSSDEFLDYFRAHADCPCAALNEE